MKKIFFAVTIIFSSFVFCSSAFCSGGMGISKNSFINKLGYSSTLVFNGFSSSRIATGFQKTDKHNTVLEYNSSLMLIISETNNNREVKSIAVVYTIVDNENELHYAKGGPPDNDVVFENICKQIIFALNNRMTDSEATKILKSIGLYGSVLDGIQRSRTIDEYSYMMKLQPGGIIMLVVSRI